MQETLMTPDIRESYITAIRASIDYILEDIDDIELFAMGGIVGNAAAESARKRRDKTAEKEMRADQERYNNLNVLAQKSIPPMMKQTGVPRNG
jgi:hypothetical protein